MTEDDKFMRSALAEGVKAAELGEIPIGAVLVVNGEIIAQAHNLRETGHDATAHAEILVLREAGRKLGQWRLSGATLYVTVEPCPMCAGALVMARIARLVYGAPDSKAGGVDSLFNITTHPGLNHRVEVTGGVLAEEAAGLLREFFRVKRAKV